MNAKNELLSILELREPIICAQIILGESGIYDEEDICRINLRLGYSEQDYAEFFKGVGFYLRFRIWRSEIIWNRLAAK